MKAGEDVVRFVRGKKGVTCPKCGAAPWIVTSAPTQDGGGPRIRYHKCRRCGHIGQSREWKVPPLADRR